MKKQIKNLSIFVALFIAATNLISCSKKDSASTPTPTTSTFTASIAGDAFSAPDAYIMPAFGGTIASIAKDSKGRSFNLSIFEKDFPLNNAVSVAFSPSISYANESGTTYIAKSGTMTITEYGKTSSGSVNHIVGNFSIVVTNDGNDITITDGKFDIRTKE